MYTEVFTRKAGQVIARDWIIAAGQAIVVAAAQALLDQLTIHGLDFKWEQIVVVSLIVFLQHVLRKASEPTKTVSIIKPSDDAEL